MSRFTLLIFIWLHSFCLAIAQNDSISGVYSLTPKNTELGFSAKHFGVINVEGSFSRFSGSLTVDNNIVTSADLIIEVVSITTQNESRDKSLKNAQFLNVDAYPKMFFKVESNKNPGAVTGNLSIKDVEKEIRFSYGWSYDGSSIQLEVEGTISRKNFQLKFGQMDGLVSDEIRFTGFVALKAK